VSEEDPRFGLVRDAFTAFEARDIQGLTAFLHPEVESLVAPPLMNTGVWHGYVGFAEMTTEWESAFGSIDYDEQGIEALDERHVLVAVHQTATGAGSGVPVELDVVFLIEFEGEQAIRFQIHTTRESAMAAI
jgi:ketosteroid isomerase-like protein